MKRGRKPKPTVLRLITGNAGKRKLNEKEPKPHLNEPTCPKWISSKAKQVWDRTIPILRYMRVLTEADGHALTCYVVAVSRWQAAEEAINRHGVTQRIQRKGQRGYTIVQRPEVSISKFYGKMMRDYQGEFGLTPSSRTRIEIPISPEEAAEDEKFFGPKTPKGRQDGKGDEPTEDGA